MGWYDTGFDRVKNQQKDPSAANNVKDLKSSRFFVKVGETRDIVFLDDFSVEMKEDGSSSRSVPFLVHEHQLLVDGDWKHPVFVTCTKGFSPCKCCELGMPSRRMGVLSIIDRSPWVKNGEKIITPRKKLLVAVPSAMKVVEAKNEKKGNLRGLRFEVSRHGEKQARIGTDYEFVGPEDLQDPIYKGLNLDPFGFDSKSAVAYYIKLFDPTPAAVIEELFAKHKVTDGYERRQPANPGTNAAASDTGSDIPF